MLTSHSRRSTLSLSSLASATSALNLQRTSKMLLASVFSAALLAGCGGNPQDAASDTEAQAESTDATTNMSAEPATEAPTGDVTVQTQRGEITLPANPNPIAVYDLTLLQDLAALGVTVQGRPSDLYLENLQAENTPDSVEVGTLFEPNLEALNALQPQAILIGARAAAKYDELANLAPTLDMSTDNEELYESSKQRLADLGALFGKTEEATQLQEDIDGAIEAAKIAAENKGDALIILINGNKMSAFGEQSRYGYLHNSYGIPLADPNIQEATHGQPISFEYIQQTNPDWLFVIDRSAAIGEEGIGAQNLLDNPLINQTKAWQNDHVIYLSPDSYLAAGGYFHWMNDSKLIQDAFTTAPVLSGDTVETISEGGASEDSSAPSEAQ